MGASGAKAQDLDATLGEGISKFLGGEEVRLVRMFNAKQVGRFARRRR